MQMRTAVTVLATLFALAVTAPAHGAAVSDFVVRGAGFGHGLGMSQWGAQGMALAGSDYREILAHYYTGTTVETRPARTLRVLLASGLRTLAVAGVARIDSKNVDPGRLLRASAERGRVVVRAGRRVLMRARSPVRLRPRSGRPLRLVAPTLAGIADGRWRGALELRVVSGRLAVVNVVAVEDYLRGVVPDEVPPSWHPEALKAQAVAARSYALSTLARGWFELYPDTRSQVYRGVTAEDPATDAAIAATSGEVVTYDGEIARTFFHSSSGGRTENVENVFVAPLPYLRAVDDPADRISPYHRWTLRFTRARLERLLGSLVRGRLRAIVVTKRGASPRVLRARVEGSGGKVATTGAVLRARLRLRSTWFTVVRADLRAARVSARASSTSDGSWLLTGTFAPRAGRTVVLEKLDKRGRFVRAATAPTTRSGAFRVAVAAPGVWRARIGSLTSLPLTVR
jgi:stage II sporulation protein D